MIEGVDAEQWWRSGDSTRLPAMSVARVRFLDSVSHVG